jgi:hypothetical protein
VGPDGVTRRARARSGGRAVGGGTPTRFDLYELCVQAPAATVRFLRAVHRADPRVLREDFCGGGAVCVAWARGVPGGRAIGVDRDAAPLRRLRGVPGVVPVRADVRAARHKADVITATNFPLGYWHERADLERYLRLTRGRLNAGGVFVADTYGGRHALSPGTLTDLHHLPDGTPVRYEWEQRSADPLTARVVNAIHFIVGEGARARAIRDAFTYDWRLWTVPELREAYLEAGFLSVEVYDQQGGAIDHLGRLHVAPAHAEELNDPWVVMVVGRL